MPTETFGDLLRNERKERRLQIAALAETLDVEPSWLRALEANDFDALPEDAVVRRCLERYAVELDVEADLMIADYDRERERFLRERAATPTWTARSEPVAEPAPEPRPVLTPDPIEERSGSNDRAILGRSTETPERPSRLPRVAAMVGALVLLTAAVAGWMSRDTPSATEPLPPAPRAGEAPTEAANVAPANASELDFDPDRSMTRAERSTPVPRIFASPAGLGGDVPAASSTGGPASKAPEADALAVPAGSTSNATATPPPETRENPPTSPSGGTLSIREHGVGTAIEDRQLVGRSERFAPGARVWYWTRVLGGSAGDRIRHVWLENGEVHSSVPLQVGATTWRTFSSIQLPTGADRPDAWAVEARDAAGRVLSRVDFARSD